MDFQTIVDGMSAMSCVVSVERLPEDGCGELRIVTGNKAYIDSIEHPAPGTQMLTNRFVPNTLYTNYLTRDMNFEDYCYRAAVKKECLHSYVRPDRMEAWLNMSFIPLAAEDERRSYCIYMMEVNLAADSQKIASVSSDETASFVLETCIRLRGTNDFKTTMRDVIKGIRGYCDAEHCCILLMNEMERSCSVLGEAFAEGSSLLPMEHYVNNEFYDIAESWTGTIAGSNCLIAKNDRDMEVVKERNPVWYESLRGAGAYNIVLFPLKSRNHLLGFMWCLNFNADRAALIKETLEVTTFILGSELGNYLLMDRLRVLGSKDMLTGVMNRNEMNNVVDHLSRRETGTSKSVGVIFADLNGLKEINDDHGHNAGDQLLRNGAAALGEIFQEKEIFRAGGDEFAVIVTDITEEELNDRIEKIRTASARYPELSFALGGAVEKDSCNVRMALRIADERMYKDKTRYYEDNPEKANESRRNRHTVPSAKMKEPDGSSGCDMDLDFLTGLLSMNSFFKTAEEGRMVMHEQGVESALVFLNLSGMKFYNKKFGFSEGDALIKETGRIIAEQFGKDRCSRFGQDQFAVFTEIEGVEQKLRSIFWKMKKANHGKTLYVRAGVYPDSMGIVETSLACDRAKFACESGRDDTQSYYRFFNGDMLAHENNRLYVIEHLEQAIAENWITAFYQPIVRSTNRKVCDEEALARWIDPERGMMSPAEFIPILEDTKLIYKVDLRIVDIIIEKIKKHRLAGLQVVPVSVNLSRTDFEMCDIVDEICNRVDAAGIPRNLITIEVTESVVGENFEFMKEQISRFQKLGFSVWMDDFGSGYSSLDLLQEIHFDLIKFDMRFMKQFNSRPESRVILTELMRMATSLNMETVTEGVETPEMVEFLCEIGCTKLQGYYFCKPIPLVEIIERYKKGTQIGFEDPVELEYQRSLSSINLYNLGAVSAENVDSAGQYFNTQPMVVLEYDGENVTVIRGNRSYRKYVERHPGLVKTRQTMAASSLTNELGLAFLRGLKICDESGKQVFVDEIMPDGDTVHALIRKVMTNPITGASAFAMAILGTTRSRDDALTFSSIAGALSADYMDLYFVDLKTEKFKEYSPDRGTGTVSVEKSGEKFFEQAHKDAEKVMYAEDQEPFRNAFTKEKVVKALGEHGVFTYTYRVYIESRPQYVTMKAVPLGNDDSKIIIGISNVDASVRQRETIERLKAEGVTYNRISALMGDFIAIYTVDPETGHYVEYSAANDYAALGAPKEGEDFFRDSKREIVGRIFEEDLEDFLQEFDRDRIMETTKKGEVFTMNYRLKIGDGAIRVKLRVGIVEEKDGPQLIVGVFKGGRG